MILKCFYHRGFMACFTSSCEFVLSYPIMFCPMLCYPTQFYIIFSYVILFYTILSFTIQSYPILFYSTLSHLMLSCPTASLYTSSYPPHSTNSISYQLTLCHFLSFDSIGAIGSNRKIDASYLSPHVNFTEFLESSTKEYGIPLLLSEPFYKLLSPQAQKYCRQVDRIKRTNGDEPIGLYTYDCDMNIDWNDKSRHVKAGIPFTVILHSH